MSDESKFISIGNEKLHYLEWGSGKKLLLAFHGYGNTAAVFDPFRPSVSDEYTVLSFDMPHHGKSKWSEGIPLGIKDLTALAETVMKKHDVEKVSLLGYSMGGRICMSLVSHRPELIEKVVLIASDGLTVSRVFYFCTRTSAGRKIFSRMLDRPGLYFWLLDWMKKIKRLDPARHKFVTQHFQTAEHRKFLKEVWLGTSELIPHLPSLKKAILKYRIPVFLFMGVYDRIIPPSMGEKFKAGLATVEMITLEKGHRVFDDTNAHIIAEHFLK
jgi:pimeloyl-ACP methyl ester carboxylesterase